MEFKALKFFDRIVFWIELSFTSLTPATFGKSDQTLDLNKSS